MASCGKDSGGESKQFDVQEAREGDVEASPAAPPPAADAAGEFSPSVGVTAAPGVAFNYRYAFRLPNTAIAKVQEQHAQMCEKLGLDRCRITGMRYRLIDEDNVSAMLALKLDPAIARGFGKDSIARVAEAEGMLVDSEISGIDAGGAIKAATRTIARNREELARLQRQLADARTASDRDSIRQQIAELQRSINASQDNRSDSEESLATTPMVFDYGSGRAVPGFDDRSPLRDAFATAVEAFENILAGIIIVIGALLPIAAIIALLWWLVRRVKPGNYWRREAAAKVE